MLRTFSPALCSHNKKRNCLLYLGRSTNIVNKLINYWKKQSDLYYRLEFDSPITRADDASIIDISLP